ncbi:MAG: hypothetical protein NPIRA04_30790 [Nitrospirales bacterium]|nr:MAG: hypothetical protein NPIRA04_30790 [Nitrospirales bacterium]
MKELIQKAITDMSAMYALVGKDYVYHKDAGNFIKRRGARLVLHVAESIV